MNSIRTSQKAKRSGFTLIEMIGVLAIIAALAGLLLPRIFESINEARINSAALGYNTAKSAAMGYFGKFGRFGDAAGAAYTPAGYSGGGATNNIPADGDWGQVLLQAGFLEKPFTTRLGESLIEIVPVTTGSTTAPATGNAAYNLDGENPVNDASTGMFVIQVKLENVSLDDAKSLNLKIDGDKLAAANDTSDDAVGKVRYTYDTSGNTTVYMYVAHK